MKAHINSLYAQRGLCKRTFLVILLGFFVAFSTAQNLIPRDGSSATNMPNLTLRGQYDIKMVSAPVLQSVWVKTANPLEILRPLTDQEMIQDGKYLSLNNEVSCASGEGTNNVKPISKLHSSAQPFAPVGAIGISTVYADCDDDMSTFQSSAAYIDFGEDMACTTIEAAYLYWFGNNDTETTTYAPYPGSLTMKSHIGGATGNVTGYNTVLFKPKGNSTYTSVKADRVINTADQFVCFADVTKLVKGKKGGLYWVANVKNSGWDDGGGSKGGWNLVVVFRPPNCPPRVIKFWDGFVEPAGGKSLTLSFATGEVPKSGNSVSYLGFSTIDAESNAGIVAELGTPCTPQNSGVQFQSLPGGTVQYINPFVTDQPGVTVTTSKGLVISNVQDGMASGRISTYDPITDKNGNELTRLPSIINTLGFGANHLKLPAGSMVAGATQAKMTFPSDLNGSYSTYMAYMAIETLQPDLRLSLRAEEASSAPGSEITYVVTVRNFGPLASKPGAYVLDTLVKMLDFKASSIQYVRGTSPQAHELSNEGQDLNENLKLYLPAIAAGNGTIASDSVVIKFKTGVKDLSRTDIWSYGCNRTAYNKASIVYTADDGSSLNGGSNSTGGCDGQGSYVNTRIESPSLDAAWKDSHFDTISLTNEVNLANANGQKIYIPARAKQTLAEKLQSLGLSVADTVKYTVSNSKNELVTNSTYFTQTEAYQKYFLEADLGLGCIETFEFTYLVAKVPQYVLNSALIKSPKFAGDQSGEVEIAVSNGSAPYTLSIMNSGGQVVYTSSSPGDYTFHANTLPAGDYTFTIADQGSIPANGSFTITDPQAMAVTVAQSKESITATTTGRNGGLNYMWYESNDNGITWSLLNPASLPAGVSITTSADTKTSTLTDQNMSAKKYEVYVCDGYSEQSAQLTSVAKPKLAIDDLSPSVSVYANPIVTLTANTTGGSGIFNYNWYVSKDKGVTWTLISSNGSQSGYLGSYTIAGNTLSISSITSTNMNEYYYKVEAADNTNWQAVEATTGSSISILNVVEGPPLKEVITGIETCIGSNDGEISAKVATGEPNQKYYVKLYYGDYADSTSLAQAILAGQAVQVGSTQTLSGLPGAEVTVKSVSKPYGDAKAGRYTVYVEPIPNPVPPYLQPGAKKWYLCPSNAHIQTKCKDLVVGSPEPIITSISVDLSEQCKSTDSKKYSVRVLASAKGGANNGAGVKFIWRSSNDGVNFIQIDKSPTVVSPAIVSSSFTLNNFQEDTYFDIKADDAGQCEIESEKVFVKALETPKFGFAERALVDTGCFKYDLHNLPVLQLNQFVDDYTVTLHSAMPTSFNDNRFLIPEDKYFVSQKMEVYARLYSGATCYDVNKLPIKIVIKDMEACYPIYIPEFFSPDGDGINDLFQMPGLEEYDNPQITIFDRYGKQVFKGGKSELLPPGGWDGKYLGHPLPSGDYWYQMIFTELKPKVGHFSIKRRKE